MSVLQPCKCDRSNCVAEGLDVRCHPPSPHSTRVMSIARKPPGRLRLMGPVVFSGAELTMLTSMESPVFHALISIALTPSTAGSVIMSAPSMYFAHTPVRTRANRLVTSVKAAVVGNDHMMMPLAPWLILNMVMATSWSGVGVCVQKSWFGKACGVPQRTLGGRLSCCW